MLTSASPIYSRGDSRFGVELGKLSYVKRFRMERPLVNLPAPLLPAGHAFIPWSHDLLELHAETLCASFTGEIDALVFPSLADRPGCLRLMKEICSRLTFIPEATWLVMDENHAVATIQGLRDPTGMGAVQNLGVIPGSRGRGIGKALILRALHGFHQATLGRAVLEVTATNDAAVRLYRHLDFVRRKILYKPIQPLSLAVE